MPSLYLLGYTVYSDFLVGTDAPQECTLDGGPQGPSVSRSPGVSPQKRAGQPMGPSTPLC